MKAFVIYLPEREHSVTHAEYMIQTLKGYGIDAALYEGVNGSRAMDFVKKDGRVLYPFSIKSRQLSDREIQKFIRPDQWENFKTRHSYTIYEKLENGSNAPKMSRPGVIGCFYSHYGLWQKCMSLNEPIMIFEDDVKFFRGWTPVEWDDVLILSLGKSAFLTNPWKTYLENPNGPAQSVTWRNYSMPGASGYAIKPDAAKALTKFYRDYFYPADNAINTSLCKIQCHNYLMGRNTLPEEGNISMTKAKDW